MIVKAGSRNALLHEISFKPIGFFWEYAEANLFTLAAKEKMDKFLVLYLV